MLAQHKILFDKTSVRGMELKNRFAMAPMGPLGLGDSHGGFNQRGIDYYTERAKGGTGLIITGVTFADNEVEEHGMPNCPCATYDPIQFVRTAREMTERIHAYGSKIWLQMSGGFGRVTIPTNLGEYPPVAPSPIMHRWLDKVCRELTVEEIHHIVKQFGKGAFNAKRAGFDGVEIHAVHEGYLIDQFAISFFNHRTDEYGGSLENRLRFAREIVEEIKSRCGQDFVVALRYSPKSFIKDWRVGALPGEEFEEKGRDLPEGVEAAKLLEAEGIHIAVINVHTIKPIDADCVTQWARKCGNVVTVEEHSVIGGLGDAVADVLMGKVNCRFRKIGINDQFGQSGKALEVLREYGLTADQIAARIKETL